MAVETVSRSKIIDVLLASPVFGKLDRAVIDALASSLRLQHVPGGHPVIREREPANEMLFLITGGLRVSRRSSWRAAWGRWPGRRFSGSISPSPPRHATTLHGSAHRSGR